jgi:SAM-dependent methyltransferase
MRWWWGSEQDAMKIPIANIIVDPQVQLKARRLDNDTVSAYVEALSNGSQFPPVTIFQNSTGLWLADGFHRVSAYRFLGLTEIEAEIEHGDKQDAMVHAATSNVAHGRPMSQAQKREAGERLIKLTHWTNVEIAKKLACAEATIRNWRSKIESQNCDSKNVQKFAQEIPGLVDLICGDFAEIAPTLEPQSIDVIITDPPYPHEYLQLYGILAEQAARLLKPGGSVLAMTGHSYLPEIFNLMTPHLAYHWVVSYLTPGGQSPHLWQRRVNTFWKPVLWFTNGEYQGPWVGDVVKSAINDNDKRFHEWGQSESGMAELVEKFSRQGDLILDPFCGAGTTGVVALELNRRFIGIDIDAKAIESTKERIYGNTRHS